MENTLEMTLEQAIAEIQDFAKETPMFVGSPKAAKIAEYLQELVDSRIKIKRLETELKADHQKAIDTANKLAAYQDKTHITAEWLRNNGFEKHEVPYLERCLKSYIYSDDTLEIEAVLHDEERGIWEITITYYDESNTDQDVVYICTCGEFRMFLSIHQIEDILKS